MRTSERLDVSDDMDAVLGNRRIIGVMGTVFTLDLRDLDPSSPAVTEVVDWWHWVDATFSTYRPDSQVSRLGAGSLDLGACSPEVRHVLDLCASAASASDGSFTDHPHGHLDPSGMVKGWSVETASRMLRRSGSEHHCITAGGDVRCTGNPGPGQTWKVGVADPHDPSRLVAVVSAPGNASHDLAVATSGTSERGLHISNPLTGRPADDLASVTVVGSDLTVADWVATAAFARGQASRTWLEDLPGVEGFAVTGSGDRWWTSGFEAWGTTPIARALGACAG